MEGVESDDVVAGQRLDRLRRTGREPAVGGIGRVGVQQEALVGEAPGIAAGLEDVGQPLGLEPLELAGVEAWLADHLGEQRQARVEVLRERLEGRARAVPARLAADLDPEALGGLGKRRRIQAPRAGHQQVRGQRRDAAERLVLRGRTRVEQEVDAHQARPGHRHQPQGQAVRQLTAGERREPIRARLAGRRSHRVGGDGHAWPPSARFGRNVGQHHAVVGAQAGAIASRTRGRIDRRIAADLGVDPLRLIEEAGVHRQPIGSFGDPLQAGLDGWRRGGSAPARARRRTVRTWRAGRSPPTWRPRAPRGRRRDGP